MSPLDRAEQAYSLLKSQIANNGDVIPPGVISNIRSVVPRQTPIGLTLSAKNSSKGSVPTTKNGGAGAGNDVGSGFGASGTGGGTGNQGGRAGRRRRGRGRNGESVQDPNNSGAGGVIAMRAAQAAARLAGGGEDEDDEDGSDEDDEDGSEEEDDDGSEDIDSSGQESEISEVDLSANDHTVDFSNDLVGGSGDELVDDMSMDMDTSN